MPAFLRAFFLVCCNWAMPSFYEFFAGGGMVRAGLGEEWECLFANDIDAKKAASYAANWGDGHLKIADVGALTAASLRGAGPLLALALGLLLSRAVLVRRIGDVA